MLAEKPSRYRRLWNSEARFADAVANDVSVLVNGTVVSSDNIDCDCGHFDYTCCAIQLHIGVERVQVTVKFVEQPVGCHSGGVSVNDATHTVNTLAVPCMCGFFSGFQHSIPGISHNVSY